MKRLLITGGGGDLGRPLSVLAAAAGYAVWVTYIQRPERIRAGRPIQVDLSDQAAVKRALDEAQPDAIIHTAVRQGTLDMREMIVNSAQNLCTLSAPSIRLITLSSDMVFDGTRAPYRESDPPSPISAYGRAKADTESLGDWVVRTSLIYDFERGNKQVDWMLDMIAQDRRISLFYDEFRSPIWADNLAEALLELVENDARGMLHIAGPQQMSRVDLGRGILDALGYRPDDHIEPKSQVGSGRQPDLTLDVSKAQTLLKTPLLTFEEARTRWKAR